MKKSEYENHMKKFLEVKKVLQEEKEYFALAKAYKKPYKWYGKQTVKESVEILKEEAHV